MKFAALENQRIAVWGYGREGRAVLKALRRRLPGLRPVLFCSPTEALELAGHDELEVRVEPPDAETLAGFQVVIKSPGISIYKPEIVAAQAVGTLFTSGTALWFGEHPGARVVGITGTKGKSTTAALTAHLARALGLRTALAGNIGLPLLELDEQEAEVWVIELSSFQTGDAGPLDVGVVTSLYEEHLDWHGTRERYVSDKLKLAAVSRILVVNATQPDLLARVAGHPRRVEFGGVDGWRVRAGGVCHAHRDFGVEPVRLSRVPGTHNALNACAALTALECAGWMADAETVRTALAALADFTPLPHRLQWLGEHDGHLVINDSISTTPEATRVALQSLQGRAVTVILGGHERGLDWASFARFAADRPGLRCVTQGANGARIHAALRAAGMDETCLRQVDTLDAAVRLARGMAEPGEVLLLSPGAPSFDQFHDYAERGRHFADLTGFDGQALGRIAGLGVA